MIYSFILSLIQLCLVSLQGNCFFFLTLCRMNCRWNGIHSESVEKTNGKIPHGQVNRSLRDACCSLFSHPAMTSIDMHEWIIDLIGVKMNISSGQQLNLLDVPNEILRMIRKYLAMVDALYSFVDTTERLISTRTLKMTCLRLKLLPERIYSRDERALVTLCRNVWPRIRHHTRSAYLFSSVPCRWRRSLPPSQRTNHQSDHRYER